MLLHIDNRVLTDTVTSLYLYQKGSAIYSICIKREVLYIVFVSKGKCYI